MEIQLFLHADQTDLVTRSDSGHVYNMTLIQEPYQIAGNPQAGIILVHRKQRSATITSLSGLHIVQCK